MKMKRLVIIFAFCFALPSLFAEIISWKGMEFGSERNPAWLKNLTKKNDERTARKRFEIDDAFEIFLGVGKDEDLESAKSYAASDCMKKILAVEETGETILNGLLPVYDFWTLDETGYTVYSLFKLKRR